MKNVLSLLTSLLFSLSLFAQNYTPVSVSFSGQSQYTSSTRGGEGKLDRSNATFQANPIFLKPGVFFSSSEVDARANRKWWRNAERMLPQPYTAHGYLPEDITLEECLVLAGNVGPYGSDKNTNAMARNNQSFTGNTQQSAAQYLAMAGRRDNYEPTRINFSKIQNPIDQRYSEKLQFTRNFYAQIALFEAENRK